MVTKERIIAAREVATDRYIRGTLPFFWTRLNRRDSQGANQFLSGDGRGSLCLVTGALWTPQGRKFDGINDMIDAGNATVDFDNFALILWFKTSGLTDPNYGVLISKRGSGVQNFNIIITTGNGRPTLDIYDGANNPGETFTRNVLDNQFHFIAFVRNTTADRLYCYLDGITPLIATDTTVNPIGDGTGNLYIGNFTAASRPFEGLISEVFAYRRSLSAREIGGIYQATRWRYQ